MTDTVSRNKPMSEKGVSGVVYPAPKLSFLFVAKTEVSVGVKADGGFAESISNPT